MKALIKQPRQRQVCVAIPELSILIILVGFFGQQSGCLLPELGLNDSSQRGSRAASALPDDPIMHKGSVPTPTSLDDPRGADPTIGPRVDAGPQSQPVTAGHSDALSGGSSGVRSSSCSMANTGGSGCSVHPTAMTAGTDATGGRTAAGAGTAGAMDRATAGIDGAGTKNTINYDGHWSGTTSNSFDFGFDVIQGEVDSLRINTVSATPGCPTSSTGWVLGAGSIVDDGFMLDDRGTGLSLHGRFVSASNANGNYALMQSGPMPCDSSGTWSATKQ